MKKRGKGSGRGRGTSGTNKLARRAIERAQVESLEVNEDSGSEALFNRWTTSRSGARAGRGFHFQDAVGAWLAARMATGIGPTWLVPEGFEDMSLEGDESEHVQIKSRVEHLDRFPRSVASSHVLDAWERHKSRADEGARLILVLERGVHGEDLLNGLDEPYIPLADRLGEESEFVASLKSAAARRGMTQPEIAKMMATTVVVGATWEEVRSATVGALSTHWDLPPSSLHLVARHLCIDVAAAADANATTTYSGRRRLDRTEVVSTIEHVAAQLDLNALESAVRLGICEPLQYQEAVSGDDRYYEGTATQPFHVASGLVVPRPGLVSEVLSGLQDRSAVVITGPSGIGKSAVLWTVPLALPGVLWFRIRRLAASDVPDLIRLARAYNVAPDNPVGLLVDAAGTADFAGWTTLRAEAAALPGLLLVATARTEDLFALGDLARCASIDVRLDESAAEAIFNGLVRREATDAVHWLEAFGSSEGLTLEFTHILAQGHRLADVASDQVQRRLAEGRHDELEILALTAVADRWSSTLSTSALADACGLADFQLRGALSRLAEEHLLVEERHGEVGGLHRLRSIALCDAIHNLPPPLIDDTVRRVLPLVPASQLDRFVASMLAEMPELRTIVMETTAVAPVNIERLAGVLQGLRLTDFYERARDWKEIAEEHDVPASAQPVLFSLAVAGVDFSDFFSYELRAARDAMDLAVEQTARDELIAEIGHAEIADLLMGESTLGRATRLLGVLDGCTEHCSDALEAALVASGSPFEASLRSGSMADIAECIATARRCGPGLAERLVEVLGGEQDLVERLRSDNPWITELDVRAVDGEVVGFCRFLHASDDAQGDTRKVAVALGRLMLRCLPRLDSVDVQGLLPGRQELTIGDFTHGTSRLRREYDHTSTAIAWNQARLRTALTLVGESDTARLAKALPLLQCAAEVMLAIGNGYVTGNGRSLDGLEERAAALHEGGNSLRPPLGSLDLEGGSENAPNLTSNDLSALITDLTGNLIRRLGSHDGKRALATYLRETVVEKHLEGTLGEPWGLIGLASHPPCLDSLRSTLLDLYAVVNELAEVDADPAKIGRSARSGTAARALERAADTCRKAERRRHKARRSVVQNTLADTGLAAKICDVDREVTATADYLVSVEVESLLDWPDALARLESALGSDRALGETFLLVPIRNGRPVPSLAAKLIATMWPAPNPEGLDCLPEAHPATLSDLFDRCLRALQLLSGTCQLPGEQQSHADIRTVADSAASQFGSAYDELSAFDEDLLVAELRAHVLALAIRVQSELDGTSIEPSFAEQIAGGLLRDDGNDDFVTAVGARYLALEWNIDAAGAIALLDS